MERKWSPTSQNPAEFERQFAAARAARKTGSDAEAAAESAVFDVRDRSLTVFLRNGLAFSFPVARVPALASLPDAVLETVKVTASGRGLHWESADVHLAVPQFSADLFGRAPAPHPSETRR